jgi:solute carrier family 26 (sodium-independent sulfate anion transporter), member 11
MSQVTASVLADTAVTIPDVKPWVVASALAVIAGGIICFIGLIRFGWIVDLISLIALSAYMTGSALNIAVGQVPTLMGNSGNLNTRDATYLVVINFFRNINKCKIDAAIGLTALFLLYAIRSICNFLARRYPKHKKLFFFISTLRTAFTILLYTLISWVVNMWHNTNPTFKILGTVPRGTSTIPTDDAHQARLTFQFQVFRMPLFLPSTSTLQVR